MGALSIPVDYRFAPGEADDGATLRVPLLALPELDAGRGGCGDSGTRRAARERVAALACPRRRGAVSFPSARRRRRFSPQGAPRADAQALRSWLTQVRGVPEKLAQFDLDSGAARISSPAFSR